MPIVWLTQWGWKWPPLWTTFSSAFFKMKIVAFRSFFYWNWCQVIQFTIQHWFRKWLGAKPVNNHYPNQGLLPLQTHICFSRPWYVNNDQLRAAKIAFCDYTSWIYMTYNREIFFPDRICIEHYSINELMLPRVSKLECMLFWKQFAGQMASFKVAGELS